MKWFRSNIKQGSRLALFALAIQFVLSFGHFHGVAAGGAGDPIRPASQALTAPRAPASSPATPVRIPTGTPNDACAICAVMAMANAVLFATPPLLRLPQAVEFSYLTTDAEFVHLELRPHRVSASRAPDLLISID